MSGKSKNTKHYEILGVSEDATLDDLKKAYKKAALKHHPDKGGDPDKFKEMAQAYEALVDYLKRRKTYDQQAEDAPKGEKGSGAGTSSRGDGGQTPSGTSKSSHGGGGSEASRGRNNSGRASGQNPSNGSESSFRGSPFDGGSRSGGSKKRGEDVIHPLKVSLEDLYLGTTKKLYVTRNVICSNCNGEGSISFGTVVACLGCQGSGFKVTTTISRSGSSVQSYACKDCKGTGKTVSGRDRCSECRGVKVVREKKVLQVMVDKGMQDGDKIIFPGEADEAPDTITGDIIFVLQQMDHPKFKRKGEDLYIHHSVSLFEAICGFVFVFTHLDGRQVPVRSVLGRVFKFLDVSDMEINGEGMPIRGRPSMKGKLHISICVTFPDSGPPEDLESFEAMIQSMTPDQLKVLTGIIATFRQ